MMENSMNRNHRFIFRSKVGICRICRSNFPATYPTRNTSCMPSANSSTTSPGSWKNAVWSWKPKPPALPSLKVRRKKSSVPPKRKRPVAGTGTDHLRTQQNHEGQHRHYDSDIEPKLSDYFPELGKTKTFADIEILDGGNDAPEPEKDRECA